MLLASTGIITRVAMHTSSRRPFQRWVTVLSCVAAAGCNHREPTSPATLALTPDRLSESAPAGSTAPRAMTIHPINVGKGDLRWAAFVKHASPWISIPVDSGTAGVDSILVWADPSGLAPGVYLDTVVVEAIAGTGTLAVPVYFRITQPVATQLRFLQQPSTTNDSN